MATKTIETHDKKHAKMKEFILYLVGVFFYTNMTGMIGSYRNAYLVNVLQLTDDQATMFNTITSVVGFILAGICIALGAAFQALGKSFFSMIVSLIRQLLVLTPVAFLLALYGQKVGNPDLVWFAYPVAELTSLTVSVICYVILHKSVISKIK